MPWLRCRQARAFADALALNSNRAFAELAVYCAMAQLWGNGRRKVALRVALGAGLGTALGTAFGVVLGVVMQNIAVGIAIGTGAGIAIGVSVGTALDVMARSKTD
jgi:zinc transporter ZupT